MSEDAKKPTREQVEMAKFIVQWVQPEHGPHYAAAMKVLLDAINLGVIAPDTSITSRTSTEYTGAYWISR